MRDAPYLNRSAANAARARRNAYARNSKALEGVRSEVDSDGRIVRAFIPSTAVPGATYELTRVDGKWVHVDRVCPAWQNHIGCVHVDALYQLDAEAR